jgi:hypothetical protein
MKYTFLLLNILFNPERNKKKKAKKKTKKTKKQRNKKDSHGATT